MSEDTKAPATDEPPRKRSHAAALGFLAGGTLGAGIGGALEAWQRRDEWEPVNPPKPGSAEAIANKWGWGIMLWTTGLLFLYAVFLMGFGLVSPGQRAIWLQHTLPLNDFLRSHVPFLDGVFARWLADMRQDNMGHMIAIFYHFMAVVVAATAWITLTHSISQSFGAKRIHRNMINIAREKISILVVIIACFMFFFIGYWYVVFASGEYDGVTSMRRFRSDGLLALMSVMPMAFSFWVPFFFYACVALARHVVEVMLKLVKREG